MIVMRKYVMMICFSLFMGWSMSGQGQGIKFFEGTFDEALAKAKQEISICGFLCHVVRAM